MICSPPLSRFCVPRFLREEAGLFLFEPQDARAIVQLYMHAKAYLDGIRSLARFAEKHSATAPSPMPMYAEGLMADHRTITENLPLVLDILKKYAA